MAICVYVDTGDANLNRTLRNLDSALDDYEDEPNQRGRTQTGKSSSDSARSGKSSGKSVTSDGTSEVDGTSNATGDITSELKSATEESAVDVADEQPMPVEQHAGDTPSPVLLGRRRR